MILSRPSKAVKGIWPTNGDTARTATSVDREDGKLGQVHPHEVDHLRMVAVPLADWLS